MRTTPASVRKKEKSRTKLGFYVWKQNAAVGQLLFVLQKHVPYLNKVHLMDMRRNESDFLPRMNHSNVSTTLKTDQNVPA